MCIFTGNYYLIFFLRKKLDFGQNILFHATCVNWFSMNDREAVLFDSECSNVTQMLLLLIDYVYMIITDI